MIDFLSTTFAKNETFMSEVFQTNVQTFF